jgi:hypothetical protein
VDSQKKFAHFFCLLNVQQTFIKVYTVYTQFTLSLHKNGGFSWGKPPVLKNVNFV